ncbi:hypothetical protein INT46_006459 [Mucor plumbeus]|uniref:Copper transport protein n=1 Tax=Mucor plumbeus TaxID=97098 RepID=A0A8H7UWM1_9FUNG|nr:hypothetical protein INT46_006459 [Mucor plumbeus]
MDHSMHDMTNMGASASSTIMSMAASATMSMASATGTAVTTTHDMSDMDMSGMSGMSMTMGTFHWSSSGDGIWFDAWVPKSEGAYIGACFGLFFFAILSRGLPALEAYFIAWKNLRDNRVAGNQLQSTVVRTDIEKSSNSTNDSSSQSFNPNAYPTPLRLPAVPPFSWSTDTVRSFLSAFSSFVSYLLMMVVMTGNGGFFVVIVIGVFFGEMAFGRFRALGGLMDDHAH